MSKNINARAAALETLIRCRRDHSWSGTAIDSAVRKYGLDRRDAALASRLCLGVLQNESLCDYYIGFFCPSKLEPVVRDVLRLGAYQLLFMDRIPARAAVSETVELCRLKGISRAAGLANAVLRRIAEQSDSLPEIPGVGTAEYLSIRYSHPKWLCELLIAEKGYSFTEAFLAKNNEAPGLCIQVNTLKEKSEKYTGKLEDAGYLFHIREPEGCIELEKGITSELPGYEEGLFYVQDRAARLAVEIAAPVPDMRVLDACSCPGGKSFAAAIRMENRGSILSCDIHEKKLRVLEQGAQRLGVGCITTRAMDARVFDPALADSFDLVIADVPCSGLGVIAKKPEIRTKEPETLRGLPEIQLSILENLSRYVKPGGVLLYSTCTILRTENEEPVLRFLEEHAAYCLEAFSVCGIQSETGMYTFWPHVDGTDGFFAAKLRRTV